MTARDREADLISHVRTHETCTPECDDFQRLVAEAEERGAARVRERVESVVAQMPHTQTARDCPGCWADTIRAALTDEAAP